MAYPLIFVIVEKITQTHTGPIMPTYVGKVSQLFVIEAGPHPVLSSVEYKILEDRDAVLFSGQYFIPRTMRGTPEVFNK